MRPLISGYAPKIATVIGCCVIAGGLVGLVTEQAAWGAVAAGWAQAFGALVAIGVAFAVPDWTRRAALKEADDGVVTYATTAWVVMRAFRQAVGSQSDKARKARAVRRMLDRQLAALTALSVSIGSHTPIQLAGFMFVEMIEDAHEAVETYLANPTAHQLQVLKARLVENETEIMKALDGIERDFSRQSGWRDLAVFLGMSDARTAKPGE